MLLLHSKKEFRLSVWRFRVRGSNSGRMAPKVGLMVCPASCPMYAGIGSSSRSSTNNPKAQQDLVKILNSPLFGKTVSIKMGPIPSLDSIVFLLPLSLCTLFAVVLATEKLDWQARAKSSLFIFN